MDRYQGRSVGNTRNVDGTGNLSVAGEKGRTAMQVLTFCER